MIIIIIILDINPKKNPNSSREENAMKKRLELDSFRLLACCITKGNLVHRTTSFKKIEPGMPRLILKR